MAAAIGIRTLGKRLRESYQKSIQTHGLEEGEKLFNRNFSKLRKEKKIDDRQFSLRGLAEGIFGESWEQGYRRGVSHLNNARLFESTAAVDVSAFNNITGQILIDRIRDNFDSPDFIGDQLMEIAPVTNGNLGTNREPWLSSILNEPGILQPQQEYPETEFIEQYIDLPALEKRGGKVSVSMEMIFADKTKQALQRADDVGKRLRFQREERQLKVVAGLVNNFKYMGTAYNTYNTSGLWINTKTSNTITSYAQISELELLFSNMVDWVTGKAIYIEPKGMQFLVTPAKMPEMKVAVHAARTRYGPFATSNPNIQQEIDEVPLINDVDYPIIKSNILQRLLVDTTANGGMGYTAANAKEFVLFGNFKKAFVYREAMPFTTEQAPPGSPAEFNQDIAVQVKAREWGVAGVQAPNQVCLSYLALA